MTTISDINLLIGSIFGLLIVFLLRRAFDRRRKPEPADSCPPNAIVVDGSNVMHWGGDPSAKVIAGVVANLLKSGLNPIVVFDASAGYRLNGRYMHHAEMAKIAGAPREHVYVVDKGVVADEVILDLAQTHGLRVVSNDRYRDWAVKFPMVKKRGRMKRGTWKGGNVVWAKP